MSVDEERIEYDLTYALIEALKGMVEADGPSFEDMKQAKVVLARARAACPECFYENGHTDSCDSPYY